MHAKQIRDLFQKGHFPFGEIMRELMETHISWVLLGDQNVYKIKKPLKLSFLDFSTLERRRFYCHREFHLNQRLAPKMYLEVVTINENNGELSVNGIGEIMDYAVRMKKMDNLLEMRKLLIEDKVSNQHIQWLASQIAQFHQRAEVVHGEVHAEDLKNDFNDILQIEGFLQDMLGRENAEILIDMIEVSNHFIDTHLDTLKTRSRNGFVRDCHGDLHSGNIFLSTPPVIFDCIEFNDHFRQIDILNEIAFFCMDLEFYGKDNLAQYFLKEYIDRMHISFGQMEQNLFLYYKYYRANVKTKVNAIKAMQESSHDTKDRGLLFRRYFQLMEYYFKQLNLVRFSSRGSSGGNAQ